MSQARRFRVGAALQVAIALTVGVPASAPADDLPPVIGATEIFVGDDWSGFGLRGFDPVSYFASFAPRPGREDLELIWGGLAWRFASEANREAFRSDPTVYAPRIGGYDAVAVANGRIVPGDPAIFAVFDGRLYLFRDRQSRARFLADESVAERAETRWPALSQELANG
jgi:hypothetical protein